MSNFKHADKLSESFLRREYCIMNRSAYAIAREVTCDPKTIYIYLEKYGIERKSPRETYLLNRDEDGFHIDNIDMINGCLLGDASVTIGKDCILARFQKTNKYCDHLLYNARLTFAFDCQKRIISTHTTLHGKIFPTFRLSSLGHEFLIPIFEKWYIRIGSKSRKIVPRGLKLTPITLLNWFLDDGSATYNYRKGKPVYGRCQIRLHSQGFSIVDNEFLICLLSEIGIRSYLVSVFGGCGFYIQIQQSDAEKFYNFIGPSPVPSLAYKWKIAEPFRYKFQELHDYNWVYDMVVTNKMTPKQISDILGCSVGYAIERMNKHKIPIINY